MNRHASNPRSRIPCIKCRFDLSDPAERDTLRWIQDIARNAANTRDMLDLSQQLELRYTGITNVVLYARGDWVQGDGNLFETQFAAANGGTELNRDSDFDRFAQKYTGGKKKSTRWTSCP